MAWLEQSSACPMRRFRTATATNPSLGNFHYLPHNKALMASQGTASQVDPRPKGPILRGPRLHRGLPRWLQFWGYACDNSTENACLQDETQCRVAEDHPVLNSGLLRSLGTPHELYLSSELPVPVFRAWLGFVLQDHLEADDHL